MKKILKYTGVWAKRVAYFLLIFVLLLSGLLHSVWVQSAAGRYAGNFCSRWSEHEVHIGTLQFNLFKKAVSVYDLRVMDKSGEPMVEAEAVYLSLSNYVFKGVDIAALSVYRPRIHIVKRQNDGMSDFKALLQKLGTLKKNKEKRNVTSIRRLRVEDGLFVYDDRQVPVRHDGRLDFKHVDVPVFSAHIDNLHIFNKHICAHVRALSAKEQCGVEVKAMHARVGFFPDRLVLNQLDLVTANSHLKTDLQFKYGSPRAFSQFAEKIGIQADIKPVSYIATRDLGYFAKPMQAYRQVVTLSGQVSGRLKDLNLRHMDVRFGQATHLAADLCWRGFPALTGSDISLDLKELHVDMADVLSIEDFASGRLRLPPPVQALTYGTVRGTFAGNLEKFDTRLSLQTDLGDADIDIRSWDTAQGNRLFMGNVTASALDVGILTGYSDWFGTVDADLQISALGARYDEMRYGLDGRLTNLRLKGRAIDTILLNCQTRKNYLHGSVTGRDPNLDFCFDGLLDYEQSEPVSQYVLDVNRVDLSALGISSDTLPFTLGGQIYTDYVGRDLDDILGNLSIRNLRLERHGETFYLPNLQLVTRATDSSHKTTEVESELLQLQLSGNYTISRFPSLYREMLRDYLPGQTVLVSVGRPSSQAVGQVFDLDLQLNTYRYDGQTYGINRLLDLFVPAFQIDEHTRLKVHCDAPAHAYDLALNSQYLGFKGILCTDGVVRIQTEKPAHTRMTASVDASAIYLNDSLALKNFHTAVALDGGDSVLWRVGWSNPVDSGGRPASGYLAGMVDLSDSNALDIRFDSSYFVFAGNPWRTYPDAAVWWRKDDIRFRNIGAYAVEAQESVLLNGRWAADTAAALNLTFRAFDMAYLSPFTRQAGMDITGKVNGVIRVRDPKSSFDLVSDIELSGLSINGGDYGKASLAAGFNRENRRIDGRLSIGPDTLRTPYLSVDGYFDLKRKTVDFSGRLNHLPVHFLYGYLQSFAEDLAGDLSGTLRMTGPVRQMKWDLRAESRNLTMAVKMLHAPYRFERFGLRLTENEIRIDNGRMQDIRYGTQGRLEGVIRHRYFKAMDMDLHLNFDKFLVLNSNPSKDMIYSGRVFATGRVDITGPTNELYIGVKAKTEDDSRITFDLASGSGASSSNFIRFESDRPVEVDPLKAFYARRRQKQKAGGHLTVDLGLEVNPQLAVGLDIRNSTISGMLAAAGEGNMRLLIEPRGTQLFGTYRILNGLFDFSMMDLINKRFKLKEGGSIVWTGPLTDARVDVEAVYTTRTSLYPVLASVGTTMVDESNLRKKVSVESIIELDGNLMNPDIRFGINLVNVEEDLKDLFFSYVNKENEDEMIRQTFSLLMLNSFMATGNAEQGGGLLSGNNALASSSELLFNQFNNFLSRLTTNFNVGMNYTPASEMNESEFQVMLSGQLFDDRLSIDGNIGVSEMEAKAASSVVGDINIEWKFTEQLRLKAFNRSNEKSLNQPDNSYTQGLGVIFRRDFNTGKELFSRIGPTKEERKRQREAKKARKQAEKNRE